MKSKFALKHVICIVIAIILVLFAHFSYNMRFQKQKEDTIAKIELGMKLSDLTWLARAGIISEKELAQFSELVNSSSNLSIEELNNLLDNILEGKKSNNNNINFY